MIDISFVQSRACCRVTKKFIVVALTSTACWKLFNSVRFSPERSSEEIERTNQFAKELVEILKSRPRCRMSFTDFVPAYHRHFGRQCKLSNFGFSKLLDLFEALPHIVEVLRLRIVLLVLLNNFWSPLFESFTAHWELSIRLKIGFMFFRVISPHLRFPWSTCQVRVIRSWILNHSNNCSSKKLVSYSWASDFSELVRGHETLFYALGFPRSMAMTAPSHGIPTKLLMRSTYHVHV